MLELRHQGEAVPVRMRLSRLRLDVLPGSVGEEGVDLEPGLEPAIVLGKIWYSHVQSVHRKALWALKCGETKQHIIKKTVSDRTGPDRTGNRLTQKS